MKRFVLPLLLFLPGCSDDRLHPGMEAVAYAPWPEVQDAPAATMFHMTWFVPVGTRLRIASEEHTLDKSDDVKVLVLEGEDQGKQLWISRRYLRPIRAEKRP